MLGPPSAGGIVTAPVSQTRSHPVCTGCVTNSQPEFHSCLHEVQGLRLHSPCLICSPPASALSPAPLPFSEEADGSSCQWVHAGDRVAACCWGLGCGQLCSIQTERLPPSWGHYGFGLSPTPSVLSSTAFSPRRQGRPACRKETGALGRDNV